MQDTEYAPAWVPESAGEELDGTIVSYGRAPDMGYGRAVVVTLDAECGPTSLFLYGTVLAGKFAELKPAIAERVHVKYHGEKRTKDDRTTYKSWSVTCPERPEWTPDWDNIGEDDLGSDDSDLPFDR